MFHKHVMRPTAMVMAIAVGLSGCASIDKTVAENDSWVSCVGAGLLGGLAGAALGAATKGGRKAIVIGATAGAATGCGAGLIYKNRVDRLQSIAKEEGLKMKVHELKTVEAPALTSQAPEYKSVGIEAQIELQEMFPVGSASLTPDGYRKLTRVAGEFVEKREAAEQSAKSEQNDNIRKKVLVVGHTDSSGSAETNQKLSEQRARAVGQILASAGISRENIYYQGAGSSRPVASNATEQGRAENRRVEFIEVENEKLLVDRVREERSNSKYLTHGTAQTNKVKLTVSSKPDNATKPAVVVVKPNVQKPVSAVNTTTPTQPETASTPSTISLVGKSSIDFAGHPVTDTSSKLASSIQPKASTFELISSAYASTPVSSCIGDLPRVDGEVKNLANDQSLEEHSTTDFFPGMNGKPWAAAVNGHVASVGPVAILRDEAKVASNPSMQFIPDFKKNPKNETKPFKSVANTYEGENQILYRVFALDRVKSPVSCMDIVFDKRAGTAVAGEIYYPKGGNAYVAQFQPKRR
jgi:outer membrane protein OmpA-like peptidoglycan-associated protein